jgi:3-mercaptopyruvate sulfurtransferase SseA
MGGRWPAARVRHRPSLAVALRAAGVALDPWDRRHGILQRLEDPELRQVDVRSVAEFSGEQLRAARGGHIPAAILWPWEESLRPDGTMRDPAEIRSQAEAAGLLPEQELVTYCQGAVRAAHAASALHIAGYPRCGSMTVRGPNGATTRRYRLTAASPPRPSDPKIRS